MNTVERFLSYALIAIIIYGCKSIVYVEEESVIYKGIEIPLYETSIGEIEEHFGKGYKKINWSDFSTEHSYKKLGISFSHRQDDSLKMVYWINAETSKNRINIEDRLKINGKSKVRDVVESLGNGSWDYDSTYNGLIIEYEYYDIIVDLTEQDILWLNKKMSSVNMEQSLYYKFKDHSLKGIEIY